ncbi:MAG: hypothetical protein JSR99_15350 [Proteobacteria bacterium]|nr:hypothetical protein [Pseudomonadota bacterium]
MMNRLSSQWIGPALGAFGALGFVLLEREPPGSRTLISWWILERALSAENALPLVGFGVAIALLDRVQAAVVGSLFLIGTLMGFNNHRAFVTVMGFVPNAADHLFLSGPIALIAAGLMRCSPKGPA